MDRTETIDLFTDEVLDAGAEATYNLPIHAIKGAIAVGIHVTAGTGEIDLTYKTLVDDGSTYVTPSYSSDPCTAPAVVAQLVDGLQTGTGNDSNGRAKVQFVPVLSKGIRLIFANPGTASVAFSAWLDVR